jgi:hypothetical protein
MNTFYKKRKYKQWWLSIPPISTKLTLIEHKKDHDIWRWNLSPGFWRAQKWAGLNRLMESPTIIKKKRKKLEAQWAEPVSLTFHSSLRKLNTESPIGASYQSSVHLTTQFQSRRLFRNLPTRNKNFLWWSCLLTNRVVIGNLYRGPSNDTFYQILIYLAKRF